MRSFIVLTSMSPADPWDMRDGYKLIAVRHCRDPYTFYLSMNPIDEHEYLIVIEIYYYHYLMRSLSRLLAQRLFGEDHLAPWRYRFWGTSCRDLKDHIQHVFTMMFPPEFEYDIHVLPDYRSFKGQCEPGAVCPHDDKRIGDAIHRWQLDKFPSLISSITRMYGGNASILTQYMQMLPLTSSVTWSLPKMRIGSADVMCCIAIHRIIQRKPIRVIWICKNRDVAVVEDRMLNLLVQHDIFTVYRVFGSDDVQHNRPYRSSLILTDYETISGEHPFFAKLPKADVLICKRKDNVKYDPIMEMYHISCRINIGDPGTTPAAAAPTAAPTPTPTPTATPTPTPPTAAPPKGGDRPEPTGPGWDPAAAAAPTAAPATVQITVVTRVPKTPVSPTTATATMAIAQQKPKMTKTPSVQFASDVSIAPCKSNPRSTLTIDVEDCKSSCEFEPLPTPRASNRSQFTDFKAGFRLGVHTTDNDP
jgi:hypothetical protein